MLRVTDTLQRWHCCMACRAYLLQKWCLHYAQTWNVSDHWTALGSCWSIPCFLPFSSQGCWADQIVPKHTGDLKGSMRPLWPWSGNQHSQGIVTWALIAFGIQIWQSCSCLPGSQLSLGLDPCSREGLLAFWASVVQLTQDVVQQGLVEWLLKERGGGGKKGHDFSCAAANHNPSAPSRFLCFSPVSLCSLHFRTYSVFGRKYFCS